MRAKSSQMAGCGERSLKNIEAIRVRRKILRSKTLHERFSMRRAFGLNLSPKNERGGYGSAAMKAGFWNS